MLTEVAYHIYVDILFVSYDKETFRVVLLHSCHDCRCLSFLLSVWVVCFCLDCGSKKEGLAVVDVTNDLCCDLGWYGRFPVSGVATFVESFFCLWPRLVSVAAPPLVINSTGPRFVLLLIAFLR